MYGAGVLFFCGFFSNGNFHSKPQEFSPLEFTRLHIMGVFVIQKNNLKCNILSALLLVLKVYEEFRCKSL